MKIRWVATLFGLVVCGCVAQIGDISSSPQGSSGSGGELPTGTGGVQGTGTGGSSTSSVGGSEDPGGGGPGIDAGMGTPSDPTSPYCKVRQMVSVRCIGCHSNPPITGVPMSLASYSDLLVPAKSTPSISVAELAFQRIQSASAPMPPAGAKASTDEIQALADWLGEGTPQRSCDGTTPPPRPDAGRVVDAGRPTVDAAVRDAAPPVRDAARESGLVVDANTGPTDPFAVAAVCTSNARWTGGNNFNMRPGEPCLNCHGNYSVIGTVYPTGHEPNDCNGVNGSTTGAQVVITDANGTTRTLAVNPVGNFELGGSIATPFRAKVVYQGRERAMGASQTNGNCNSCHTQNGNGGAPGRIVLP